MMISWVRSQHKVGEEDEGRVVVTTRATVLAYTKGKIVGNSGTGLEDSDIHRYILGRLGFKNM